MSSPQARVPVHLGPRSYEVRIEPGLLGRAGELVAAALGGSPARAAVACDAGLPKALVESCEASLRAAGMTPLRWSMAASEGTKSLATLGYLLDFLAAHRLERTEPVIALGGGIVGDLAGFAAATYRRGVPLIHCPTTLLAMVDASVGGKTAINLGSGPALLKNMAGAFHQPRAVLIDPQALGSLPERFFRAGLAECIKHGMIAADWKDPGLLDWIAAHADALLTRDPEALVALISRNVRIKAAVVETDEREEREEGGRALLNLGHTFAHAIETLPTVSPDGDPRSAPLQHGEAVALGLVAAARTAEAAGVAAAGLTAKAAGLLATFELPTRVAGLPSGAALLERMTHDKKVKGGRLRLVLPVEWGRATVVSDPPPPAVLAGLDAIRA